MFDLDNLYSEHKLRGENPLCDGCSILSKNKPCHSVMDYEKLDEAPTLFLSDSLKYKFGGTFPFLKAELNLITEAYRESFMCAASVKCPSVKEADMTPDNMVICRAHLEATIDKVKPKLVFVCGNLAMKMLIKKSGITSKRGKSYEFTSTNEPDYTRVWVLLRRILENPKNRKVFHNAKFDLKFLINYGIYTKNVWDTKIMHHFIDENVPKSLMDLVKIYFSSELEDL